MDIRGSRYATSEEIEKSTVKVSFNRSDNPGGGIPFVNDGTNAYVDSSFFHSLIVGSTGSGKTRRIVLPTIHSISRQVKKSSMIIYDPKGELLAHTKRNLDDEGYDVFILNLKEPDRGDTRYNPLYVPCSLYQAGMCSMAIRLLHDVAESLFYDSVRTAKDPFWPLAAQSYCEGLLICAAQFFPAEEVNFDLVYSLHSVACSQHLISDLYTNDRDNFAWRKLSTCLGTATETRKSIHSEFDRIMSALCSNSELLDVCSGKPDFLPNDFFESDRPIALFLVVNDASTFGSEIAGIIIEQLYKEVVRIADSDYEGVIPRRIEFILDEFSTLKPPLADINLKISTSRSRNIRFTFCCQSLLQLSYVYGEELAGVILTNVNNLIYMYSTDQELHQYLEKRAGTQITEYTGERRSLIVAEDLAHYEMGKALIFHGRDYPYITMNLPDISEYGIEKRAFHTNELPKRKLMPRMISENGGVAKVLRSVIYNRYKCENEENNKKQIFKVFGKRLSLRVDPPGEGMSIMMFLRSGEIIGRPACEEERKYSYYLIGGKEILRGYDVVFTEEHCVDGEKEGIVLYYKRVDINSHKPSVYDCIDMYAAIYDPGNMVYNRSVDDITGVAYPLYSIDEQKTFKSVDMFISYLEGIVSHIQSVGIG